MLADDTVDELTDAVQACDQAREALSEALDAADASGGSTQPDPSDLAPVAAALEDWRDAQRQFMTAIEDTGASDPATAALLLQTNHGVDASNARCGIPGTDVEGADQPFPLDLSGAQGMALTRAATEHFD
ncbi:MAG: hypothetical protein BRD41_00585 [Bacteroidetes bacterium QS_1_63_11]|nr:MAG: hypothetical protein BRD41_00585 [Bacteroidetes bacterium QS_1_63_11]